ncbi:helix-turn-helix domain-containing protein [Ralstonia pseudosolanacearum]|uniref:helix-turn-helix domain-containing protein n=1 Tax=Ralstonia pseudosolanacearum TaxID=1310165 RepID=UPI00399D583C
MSNPLICCASSPRDTQPEVLQTFSGRGKELRGQRELAERVTVDGNWVSAIESGRQNVSLRTLRKFSDALSTAPIDLLG